MIKFSIFLCDTRYTFTNYEKQKAFGFSCCLRLQKSDKNSENIYGFERERVVLQKIRLVIGEEDFDI